MAITKVLVVCTKTFGGGAERATVKWSEHMLALGHRIVWVHSSDNQGRELHHPNITYRLMRLEPERAKRLCDLVREEKLDFCFFANPDAEIMLAEVEAVMKTGLCKVGVSDHSCYFYPLWTARPEVYRRRQEVFRRVDLVTALSPENVAWFRSSGVRHVVEMPNYLTFNPSSCQRTPDDIQREEVLFVGRLCAVKAPERALEALATLRTRPLMKEVHLTFLGRYDNADWESRLRERVQALGLSACVTFAGEVKDVAPYFRRARVLLMTSRMEGAPMVLDEARAYGVPAVMYALPYVPRTSEANGVLAVPQDDRTGLADALQKCITDDAYYAKLSQTARKSLDAVSDEVIDARWQQVFSILESGTEIVDPMCEKISADVMYPITLDLMNQAIRQISSAKTSLETELQAVRAAANEAAFMAKNVAAVRTQKSLVRAFLDCLCDAPFRIPAYCLPWGMVLFYKKLFGREMLSHTAFTRRFRYLKYLFPYGFIRYWTRRRFGGL